MSISKTLIQGKTKYLISGTGTKLAFDDFVCAMGEMNHNKPIKKWNDNRKKYWLDPIIRLLEILSGNDIIALLNDIVDEQYNGNKIFTQLSALYPYNDTMNKLKSANLANDNHMNKWQILQYVTAFDIDTLQNMGFDCGRDSIKNAKNTLANNNNIPIISKPKKTVPWSLTPAQIEAINHHLYINSRPAPSEICKNESKLSGHIVQKRFMCCSYKDAYNTFPDKDQFEYDAFLSHKGKEFALPRRDSDKCHFCKEHHQLNRLLGRKCQAIIREEDDQKDETDDDDTDVDSDDDVLEDIDFEFDKNVGELSAYRIDRLKEHYDRDDLVIDENERQLWKNRLDNYELIIAHRAENEATRAKYNKDIDEMKAGEMVVVFDFKQNLVVGHCPNEEHFRFRNLSQRTCFNATIFTIDKMYIVDVISDCLKHSTLFTKQAFRRIFDEPAIKNVMEKDNISSVKFWCDNGPHFKSNKFIYYPLVEFINKFFSVKKVSVNYFCPYHGKNDCDCHFGRISYWMEYYSNKWKNGIQTTNNICDAIIEGTDTAGLNNSRARSKRRANRAVTTVTIDFDLDTEPIYTLPLQQYYGIEYRIAFHGIKSVYYFESNKTLANTGNLGIFQFGSEIVKRTVDKDDSTKTTMSINYNDDLLYAKYPENNDRAWNKWVNKNKTTEYQYDIKVKPFPYSDNDKSVKVSFGIDRCAKNKQAPKKQIPLFNTDVLQSGRETRVCIFDYL